MDYRKIDIAEIGSLWELQNRYKAEIGEDAPGEAEKERLADAIEHGQILFYGVWNEGCLIACCSVTVGFSTFDYLPHQIMLKI